MSFFDDVKEAVTVTQVAKQYGYTPNRAGFICCPFHAEKTPSMKLYPRQYHCFGCGKHGSVVDFVAGLFGLSPLDAAKKINADFGLGLCDSAPDRDNRRSQILEVKALFDGWREQMLNHLDKAIRTANSADFERLSDAEVTAIVYREAFEYWAEILMHGTLAQQMEVFRDREGVERLCKRALKSTPPRSNTA